MYKADKVFIGDIIQSEPGQEHVYERTTDISGHVTAFVGDTLTATFMILDVRDGSFYIEKETTIVQ